MALSIPISGAPGAKPKKKPKGKPTPPDTPRGDIPLEDDPGVWFVGVGPSTGQANISGFDTGIYFTSEDGLNWDLKNHASPRPDRGFTGSAYADGLWVSTGIRTLTANTTNGIVTSTTDPRNSALWQSDQPYGFIGGTVAATPTAYDNDTGLFTVPLGPLGSVTVLNDAAPADPVDPTWPHLGADYLTTTSVVGFGTLGWVEVRVRQIFVTVDPLDRLISNGSLVSEGAIGDTWPTDVLEARKFGSLPWVQVLHVGTGILTGPVSMLDGTAPDNAGIRLRGLVWGIVDSSVQFAPGAD